MDNRYTEAYGPHEVMLNIDGINIYRKTMITCDEDLVGQIYVGKEELKVRSIGHCAMSPFSGSVPVPVLGQWCWDNSLGTIVLGH